MTAKPGRKKQYVKDYRTRAREKGGVIVYAMLTDPEAIKAWEVLKILYGNNRDAIEAAIIDSYKELEAP